MKQLGLLLALAPAALGQDGLVSHRTVDLNIPAIAAEPGEEVALEFRVTLSEPLLAAVFDFDLPAGIADFIRTEVTGTASDRALPQSVIFDAETLEGVHRTGIYLLSDRRGLVPAGSDVLLLKAVLRIRPDAAPGNSPVRIVHADISLSSPHHYGRDGRWQPGARDRHLTHTPAARERPHLRGGGRLRSPALASHGALRMPFTSRETGSRSPPCRARKRPTATSRGRGPPAMRSLRPAAKAGLSPPPASSADRYPQACCRERAKLRRRRGRRVSLLAERRPLPVDLHLSQRPPAGQARRRGAGLPRPPGDGPLHGLHRPGRAGWRPDALRFLRGERVHQRLRAAR